MARDGLFFTPAARLNARHVPGPALWLQGAWASVLALSGRYGDLLDYVIIAELVFYLFTVGGLFLLARRTGERPGGVGYPWLQGTYLFLVGVLVVDLLVTKPAYTWAASPSSPAGCRSTSGGAGAQCASRARRSHAGHREPNTNRGTRARLRRVHPGPSPGRRGP